MKLAEAKSKLAHITGGLKARADMKLGLCRDPHDIITSGSYPCLECWVYFDTVPTFMVVQLLLYVSFIYVKKKIPGQRNLGRFGFQFERQAIMVRNP